MLRKSASFLIVCSEYTAPDGLFGELIITAFVFLFTNFSNSSKLIWKFFVSGATTLNFAPAAVTNTLYSGKNGAIAIISSSDDDVSALNAIESDAAAPIVI